MPGMKRTGKWPSMKWTLEMRTFLHVLCSEFVIAHSNVARIFWHVWPEEVAGGKYEDEGDLKYLVHRLYDCYGQRLQKGRSKTWISITANEQTQEEWDRREDLKDLIRDAATTLGIAIVEANGNDEDGQNGDDENDSPMHISDGDDEEIEYEGLDQMSSAEVGAVRPNTHQLEDAVEGRAESVIFDDGIEIIPAPPRLTEITGRSAKASDSAQLYSTNYVNTRTGLVWHQRGSGGWAEGLPMSLEGKNQKKVHIRVPKNAITLPGAEEYMKTSNTKYNTVTANNIKSVFPDPQNIQKQPRGLPGKPAHYVPGTKVAIIPRADDDDEMVRNETDLDLTPNFDTIPDPSKIKPWQVWDFSMDPSYAQYWSDWKFLEEDDNGRPRVYLDRSVPNPPHNPLINIPANGRMEPPASATGTLQATAHGGGVGYDWGSGYVEHD